MLHYYSTHFTAYQRPWTSFANVFYYWKVLKLLIVGQGAFYIVVNTRLLYTWVPKKLEKHCKNSECCPVSQLIVRSQRLSWIQDLNCQSFNQCLKCHKSLGLLLGGVLKMSLYLSLSLSKKFWSCHVFSSLWTNVSKVTSLKDFS